MFTFPTQHRRWLAVFLSLFTAGAVYGQHPWQEPPHRDPAEIARIIGPIEQREPSRDLNIVWVWGVDKNHDRGAHEYAWVMDRFVNTLLPAVPRVTTVPAMYFPTEEQWKRADLVVFYLQSREAWGKKHYDLIKAFQARGGGLIFLHLALLQFPGDALEECIGLSYGTQTSPNGPSGWGVLPTPVKLTKAARESPLFEGFPREIDLVDEHYWNLSGDPNTITTMVTSPAGPSGPSTGPPEPEELDGKEWPLMWTKVTGRGRVFASGPGHNYFTFNDPYFRIILLRAMAWTMNESFDPFKPLVTLHLER